MKVQAVALALFTLLASSAKGTRTLKHKHKSSKAANNILPKLTTGQSSCIAGGNRTQDISCIGGNYCVGSCGSRVSADPRVFGPHLWTSFHMISVNYPENPNQDTKLHCEGFVNALPYMLPCPHCGWHLREFISTNEVLSGQESDKCAGAPGESKCQSISEVCSSKSNLVSFFVRAHNNVNKGTHPCRQLWSTADAQIYESQQTCVHNIVWGQCELNRSEDDNHCCAPDSEYFLLGPAAGNGNPCKSSDGSDCTRQPACYAEPDAEGIVPDGREFSTVEYVSAMDIKSCKDAQGDIAQCPATSYQDGTIV